MFLHKSDNVCVFRNSAASSLVKQHDEAMAKCFHAQSTEWNFKLHENPVQTSALDTVDTADQGLLIIELSITSIRWRCCTYTSGGEYAGRGGT